MRLEVTRGPGAEACPADQVLHDVLASRMSWDPIDSSAPARLVASLTKRGRVFLGHVEIHSASGAVVWQRELDPLATCESVVEGLGFVAALKLDPAGPPAGRPAAPIPSPPIAPAASAIGTPIGSAPIAPPIAPPAPPIADPAAPIETRPKIQVGLAGGVGFGVSPSTVAGIGAINVGIRWPALSVQLEARAFPIASGAGAGTASSATITTGLFGAAAVGCAHWRALAGCGVLDVGALRATAPADHPVTAVVTSVRAGLRAAAELPLGDILAIKVSGDALLGLQRPALKLDGAVAWTAPVIAGGLQAGLVVSF